MRSRTTRSQKPFAPSVLDVAGDDDGRAAQEREQQLLDGHIEANGGEGEDAVAGSERIVAFAAGKDEIDGGGVRNGNAFGLAGGAGRIDDVSETVGVCVGWEVGGEVADWEGIEYGVGFGVLVMNLRRSAG